MRILSLLSGLILSTVTLAEVTIYAIDIPGLHEKMVGAFTILQLMRR